MNFILLATYNGARFLSELIESIRAQSVSDWRMLVRDDGSIDATVDVLRALAVQDQRIVICNSGARRGAARNFESLMHEALAQGAEYLFFADQDDVWLRTKLEHQLVAMRAAEHQNGSVAPILVHSDLTVVDEQLRPLQPSFMQAVPALGAGCQLPGLLLYNNITGCATLINRRLAELALPFPNGVLIHDWWVAQLAACAGQIVFVDQSLVLYRNHGANAVGAVTVFEKIMPWRAGWWRRFLRARSNFDGAIQQAVALYERLIELGSENVLSNQFAIVARFCETFRRRSSPVAQYRALRSLGMPRISLATSLVLLARLTFRDRQRPAVVPHPAVADEDLAVTESPSTWRQDAASFQNRPKAQPLRGDYQSREPKKHPPGGAIH